MPTYKAPHRQTPQQRLAAKRYQTKRRRRMHGRKPHRLTPAQRRAVQRLKSTGFYKKLARFRESIDPARERHHPAYVAALVEAAAVLRRRGMDETSVADLVAAFVDRPAATSNTPAGLSSLMLEAAVASNESVAGKFVDVELVDGKTYYALFLENLTLQDVRWLAEASANFADEVSVLVERGQFMPPPEDDMVSDFAILKVTAKDRPYLQPTDKMVAEGVVLTACQSEAAYGVEEGKNDVLIDDVAKLKPIKDAHGNVWEFSPARYAAGKVVARIKTKGADTGGIKGPGTRLLEAVGFKYNNRSGYQGSLQQAKLFAFLAPKGWDGDDNYFSDGVPTFSPPEAKANEEYSRADVLRWMRGGPQPSKPVAKTDEDAGAHKEYPAVTPAGKGTVAAVGTGDGPVTLIAAFSDTASLRAACALVEEETSILPTHTADRLTAVFRKRAQADACGRLLTLNFRDAVRVSIAPTNQPRE